jgi:hypothetical protein
VPPTGSEIHPGGFRLTLGMYITPELAALAYDAATWRLGRPGCNLNYPKVQSLAEAKFLAPAPSTTRNVLTSDHFIMTTEKLVIDL